MPNRDAAIAGSLDAVRQVLRLNVYTQCGEHFTQLSEVADGASELLVP